MNSTPDATAAVGGDATPRVRTPTPWRRTVHLAAILTTGLHAGFFLTYAISVTTGLALVDDATYVQSFQAINEAVRTPVFMVLFAGAAPITAAALVARWSRPTVRSLLLLALVAELAVVAITFAGNVPLNERLAAVVVEDGTAAAARAWFEGPWNALNLARTLAAVTGFGAVAVTGTRR